MCSGGYWGYFPSKPVVTYVCCIAQVVEIMVAEANVRYVPTPVTVCYPGQTLPGTHVHKAIKCSMWTLFIV